ncbi:hypothetical protein Hanom_Chr15g01414291 [Helianthus anomalus]
MIEAWWIRSWCFLYISASVMLPNFRSSCHAGFRRLRKVMRLLTLIYVNLLGNLVESMGIYIYIYIYIYL